MRRYELVDTEWERIKKYFFEKVPGTPSRPPKPAHPIISGIVWISRCGAPWRDLPESYGSWKTVYTRSRELITSGVPSKMFNDLNIDSDMQDISPDSTSFRVHQHGKGLKKWANPPKQDVRVVV